MHSEQGETPKSINTYLTVFFNAYGLLSINVFNLQALPGNTNSNSFLAMMYDGENYHLFQQQRLIQQKEPVQNIEQALQFSFYRLPKLP